MIPLKSTTSAKTNISNSLTPILRSARNRNIGADSEDMKEFNHTEFTQSVNDDDDDEEEIDLDQDSQSNDTS